MRDCASCYLLQALQPACCLQCKSHWMKQVPPTRDAQKAREWKGETKTLPALHSSAQLPCRTISWKPTLFARFLMHVQTAKGWEQAMDAGEKLKSVMDADGQPYRLFFYTSPYLRCKQVRRGGSQAMQESCRLCREASHVCPHSRRSCLLCPTPHLAAVRH
jgi:hypothetical protein